MTKRAFPEWDWRFPFSTGIFSVRVPDDYDWLDQLDEGRGFLADPRPSGGSPPPDYIEDTPYDESWIDDDLYREAPGDV